MKKSLLWLAVGLALVADRCEGTPADRGKAKSQASSQQVKPSLDKAMVTCFLLNWYAGTNDHLPVEQIEPLLAEDVIMRYPTSPDPVIGRAAFRKWYADVLTKYFDETHHIESLQIQLDGNKAVGKVIVRWECRTWDAGAAKSQYQAFLAHQSFIVERMPDDGRLIIREKIVEKFEKTTPIFGLIGR